MPVLWFQENLDDVSVGTAACGVIKQSSTFGFFCTTHVRYVGQTKPKVTISCFHSGRCSKRTSQVELDSQEGLLSQDHVKMLSCVDVKSTLMGLGFHAIPTSKGSNMVRTHELNLRYDENKASTN